MHSYKPLRPTNVRLHDNISVLFAGVYMSLKPVVLVDLLGLEKLSNAFGVALLFQGVGALAGPPLAGKYVYVFQK